MFMQIKCQKLDWPASRFGGPRIIGHRGACHHAHENSLAAFALASELGADMWELDVRLSKDGICMVCHDDDLQRLFGMDARISERTAAELKAIEAVDIPTLAEVIELAQKQKAGLYIELKAEGAGPVAMQALQEANFTYAVLGSFEASWVAQLVALDCPYPLSVLIKGGDDPFEQAKHARCDAIHLCWEKASATPQTLLTPQLFKCAQEQGVDIIIWHEERPDVIRALIDLPVEGICSDRPELLVPYAKARARPSFFPKGPEICCHRGVNKLAPENTMAAAQLTFEQDFDWLEIDIHETIDGQLVVFHDATLERTSNGRGQIANYRMDELQNLDVGFWFSKRFAGQKMPSLQDMIHLAKHHGKGLYIEIKQANAQKVLDVVQQMDFMPHCFFWSFDWSCITQMRSLSKEAQLMARSLDFHTPQQAVESVQADIIEINMNEDVEALVLAARKTKARIMLCYMGEEVAIFERIIDLKPDMINVNQSHIWKEVWFKHCQKHQQIAGQ
ncbi:MAG: glycerophosphodiester phosphodiesterase family protein [Cohaesibacter sp.]|nr:glycerophosphodiester phosphodiesterase family protein [Cohaesibacter sp.]